MFSPLRAVKDRFLRYALALRFPKLVALTLALFSIDFIIPDVIPFADEVLLALLAALLASFKKSRRERTIETEARLVESTPKSAH